MRTSHSSSPRIAVLMSILLLLTAHMDVMVGTYITRGKSPGTTKETPCAGDPDYSESGLLLFSGDSLIASNSVVQEIMEDLVEAIEKNDTVTVVGDVHLGMLLCESLLPAEAAPKLRIAISPDETIIARKTSFTVLDGKSFIDGIERKVWTGEEIIDDIGVPYFRTVSMTWGAECNIETFLLKVTKIHIDGTLSVIKSVPCLPGATIMTCVLEVELELGEEEHSHLPTINQIYRNETRLLRGTRDHRGARSTAPDPRRKLQSTPTTVDVMMLYSEDGKGMLGNISDAQMQTTLATALSTSNEALVNSGVDMEFSLVHVGPLPYDESNTSSSAVLSTLAENESVAELRDEYGADLVQLAADIGFSCGRGYLYSDGNSLAGFSIVNPICLDYFSHTHELGHNLGCYHNRDNSDGQTEYAHGYQDCDEDTDPFRTIMSYACTSAVTVPRINWFSNPDVYYMGKPTGTATEDCARSITENMEIVSNFRESVLQTTPAPTTPAPTTLVPRTTAPTSPAPSTPAPITPAPSTPAPTTPAPNTPAPTTLAPSTSVPYSLVTTTAAPTNPASITPAPSTPAPTTPAPTTLAPSTSAPYSLVTTTAAPTNPAPSTPAPMIPRTASPVKHVPITPYPTAHMYPTTGEPTNSAQNQLGQLNHETTSSSLTTPSPSQTTDIPACLDITDTRYRCDGKSAGTIIDLNRCQLTDEHSSMLRSCFETASSSDLSSITKIKLNWNDFTTLPSDLLDGMTSLQTLNLQRNCNLACVPRIEEEADPEILLSSCSTSVAAIECGR